VHAPVTASKLPSKYTLIYPCIPYYTLMYHYVPCTLIYSCISSLFHQVGPDWACFMCREYDNLQNGKGAAPSATEGGEGGEGGEGTEHTVSPRVTSSTNTRVSTEAQDSAGAVTGHYPPASASASAASAACSLAALRAGAGTSQSNDTQGAQVQGTQVTLASTMFEGAQGDQAANVLDGLTDEQLCGLVHSRLKSRTAGRGEG
jgi:hypothetical protein